MGCLIYTWHNMSEKTQAPVIHHLHKNTVFMTEFVVTDNQTFFLNVIKHLRAGV